VLFRSGWEYVWHCHILGHEENDMMRAIAFNVPPEAPSGLVVAAAVTGLNLTRTDNSASETGFTLQRDTTAAFAVATTIAFPVGPSTPTDINLQGIGYGGPITFNDASATGAGPYFYRVQAFKPGASYWTPLGNLTSAWSNTATVGATAGISPAALAFGTVALGVTSPSQTVTISNTGTLPLAFTFVAFSAPVFTTPTNLCPNPLPANSSCTLTVAFTPTVAGPVTGTLTVGTSDPANPTLTVSLTGAGGAFPLLTITASNATMKYGGAVPIITPSFNPPNPVGLTGLTCSTTATSTNATPVGTYPSTCSGALGNYTFTYVAGTVSVTPVPLTIFARTGTMPFGGTVPTFNPLPASNYVGFVALDTPASLTTLPTCTTGATNTNTTPPGTYPSSCTGAVDPNYTISYVNGAITITRGAITVTTNNATRVYGAANPPVPTTITGMAVGDTLASLGIACSFGATANSGLGTYTGTCSGPASTPNYATITYVNTGLLTITAAPLTITASSPTMVYGGAVPAIIPNFSGFVNGQTNLTGLTTQPTCTTTATNTSPASPPTYPSSCSGAVGSNYAITYVAGAVTVAKATSTTTITSHLPSPSNPGQVVTVAFSVAPQFTGTPTGSVTVTSGAGGPTCTATLTAGAGSCTLTFTTAGSKTLTAAYGGNGNFVASTSAGVTHVVNASGPIAQVTPAALTFNSALNVTTTAQPVTVKNIGTAALVINSITRTGTNPGQFADTNVNCPIGGAGLPAGQSCTINVTFTPTAAAPLTKSAILHVNVAAPATSQTVTLTGTINVPVITPTPASLAFGTHARTTTTTLPVTLQNTGTAPLTINGITLTGTNPGQFSQTNTCGPFPATIPVGGSCTASVSFRPTTVGAKSANLRVAAAAPATTVLVPLTGTGN
jgi:hypothetical protein